jgi:hypothetical protein
LGECRREWPHQLLGETVVYVQSAIGVSMIAFGGFSLGTRRSGCPRRRGAAARAGDASRRRAALRRSPADASPAREIRLRDVTFATRGHRRAVLEHFDLTIPPARRSPSWTERRRQDDDRKAAVPLYDPQSGAIEIDGVDIREFDLASWRSRVTAVFQDFIRLELPLRDNVAPAGAPDDVVQAALESAGAANLAALDTVLARGYEGGTDLSGGQWQRIALARALAAVRSARRRCCSTSRRAARCRGERRSSIALLARDAALHHHPDLAPLLHSPPRRSNLRARARPGHRARHTRRADGVGRALSDDVRSAGTAIQYCQVREGATYDASPDREPAIAPLPPALSSMWRLCKLGYRHEPR